MGVVRSETRTQPNRRWQYYKSAAAIVLAFICYAFIFVPFIGPSIEDREYSNKINEDNQTKKENPKSVTVSSRAQNSKEDSPIHHCINEDFKPKHKVSVWTMLNDNPAYVGGALKMGRGVVKFTKTPIDLVVMELQSKPLTSDQWVDLHKVGFVKCIVESIPAPEKTRHDLTEKFAVLHVWAMTVYDTVLFLDADTLVTNSLDSLISLDLNGKNIGVTKDIRAKKWVDSFNSGVLLLHPSINEYKRLRKLLISGIEFEYIMSDQGFLNVVYKDDWHEIGFVNNANLAVYRFDRKYWDKYPLEQINVIHYTMQKPWKCNAKGSYGPICKVWLEAD